MIHPAQPVAIAPTRERSMNARPNTVCEIPVKIALWALPKIHLVR